MSIETEDTDMTPMTKLKKAHVAELKRRRWVIEAQEILEPEQCMMSHTANDKALHSYICDDGTIHHQVIT